MYSDSRPVHFGALVDPKEVKFSIVQLISSLMKVTKSLPNGQLLNMTNSFQVWSFSPL